MFVIALAISAVTMLAGVAGDDSPRAFDPSGVSEDRFPVAVEPQRIDVDAHDDVPLHVRIYRPDTSSDPVWRTPVILVSSPYFDGTVRPLLGSDRELELVRRYTPKGYTVVLASNRGTGNSGGCYDYVGPKQGLDFVTLVEYFASQPWSNGRVGSFGFSADGDTQNAGAVRAPKGLTTMVTGAALSSIYDLNYFGGVPYRERICTSCDVPEPSGPYSGYALFTAVVSDPTTDPVYMPRMRERADCLAEHAQNQTDTSGTMTEYWRDRDFRIGVSAVQASVLHVQGFTDTVVLPVNIAGWYDELPSFKRAILGQWAHARPDTAGGWARDDWFDMLDAWFDQFLLDLDTGVEGWPEVQVQDERNVWRVAPSFAALGSPTGFPLAHNGKLGKGVKPGSAVRFAETGEAVWTMKIDKPIHISGQPTLEVDIALDKEDAHFAAALEEVRLDGSVRPLTRGYVSVPHHEQADDPRPVTPGARVRYTIEMIPLDARLAKGSRLRLTLRGADDYVLPAGTLYTASVATDGSSTLVLPLVVTYCGLIVRQARPPLAPIPGCPE